MICNYLYCIIACLKFYQLQKKLAASDHQSTWWLPLPWQTNPGQPSCSGSTSKPRFTNWTSIGPVMQGWVCKQHEISWLQEYCTCKHRSLTRSQLSSSCCFCTNMWSKAWIKNVLWFQKWKLFWQNHIAPEQQSSFSLPESLLMCFYECLSPNANTNQINSLFHFEYLSGDKVDARFFWPIHISVLNTAGQLW